MSDASLTLQAGIYAALTAAPSIGAAVYDAAPQAAAYPHIEIGDGLAMDWSAALLRGEQHRVDIHVWSRYRGAKELKTLMAEIKDRLHHGVIADGGSEWEDVDWWGGGLAGNRLVEFRFSDAETMTDADGLTRHGIIRFIAITTKSAA